MHWISNSRGVRTAMLVGPVSLALASPSGAQKGKQKTPPSPTAIAATFADAALDAVRSDSAGAYAGYHVTDSNVLDGAFINSRGGIDINLVPESSPGDRAIVLSVGSVLASPPVAPPAACQLDGETVTAREVDFRFNVTDSGGNAVGIGAMGLNGVPTAVTSGGLTPGYDVAAIINFLPDGTDPSVKYFTLRYGGVVGTTITRLGLDDEWTVTSQAQVLLQCTVTSKGKATTNYDIGTDAMPFTLTVLK